MLHRLVVKIHLPFSFPLLKWLQNSLELLGICYGVNFSIEQAVISDESHIWWRLIKRRNSNGSITVHWRLPKWHQLWWRIDPLGWLAASVLPGGPFPSSMCFFWRHKRGVCVGVVDVALCQRPWKNQHYVTWSPRAFYLATSSTVINSCNSHDRLCLKPCCRFACIKLLS